MTTFTTSLVIALVALVVLCLAGLFEVACMYTDAAKESAAKDDKIADLEETFAELTERMSDARVVMPLRPVPVTERPDLRVIPPQRSDSWLEDVMDEQARLGKDGA